MNATLDQIEAALYGALGALVAPTPTPAAPFRHLRRYAGEVTAELVQDIERGIYDLSPEQLPAALLAWEGEDPVGAEGAFTEAGGHAIEVVGRSVWRVYCVVRDLRGDEEALKGTLAGQPGALLCAHAVKKALAGFVVAGLHDGRTVRWVGSRPVVIARRTAYVYAVRFSADAALDESTDEENPTPGAPLAGVRGAVVDAARDTDGAEVPLSSFNTLPED
ncbi:MAG: hypothetical protein U0324_46970 [Polyangiales bacterium]